MRQMVQENSFLRRLDSSLSGLIAHEPIEVLADWSTKRRKTYQSETQHGSGVGPFVEVEDRRWQGALHCPSDSSAILFLLTASKLHWAKAPMIAPTLPVEVSFHAYTECAGDRSTFSARMAGAVLPGVPVATPASLADVCARGPIPFRTGCVFVLAQTEGAAFAAVVLPDTALKMGRNHLWRLRDDVASSLGPDIRELLTRRRSGHIEIGMV
jgi:hypothetical protein